MSSQHFRRVSKCHRLGQYLRYLFESIQRQKHKRVTRNIFKDKRLQTFKPSEYYTIFDDVIKRLTSDNFSVYAVNISLCQTLGAGRLDKARRQKGLIINGAAVFGMCFALLGFLSTLLIPLVYGSLSDSARSVVRGIVCVAAAYMVV